MVKMDFEDYLKERLSQNTAKDQRTIQKEKRKKNKYEGEFFVYYKKEIRPPSEIEKNAIMDDIMDEFAAADSPLLSLRQGKLFFNTNPDRNHSLGFAIVYIVQSEKYQKRDIYVIFISTFPEVLEFAKEFCN